MTLFRPNPKTYKKKKSRQNKIPKEIVKEVMERDNHRCQNPKCTGNFSALQVHHIKTTGSGGKNNPDNLITLCAECHFKVGAGNLKIDINGR